jgi:hypothetical protein
MSYFVSTVFKTLAALVIFGLPVFNQTTVHRKQLLAIGEEKGYRHDSISHAVATIERLGRETDLWDTTIRTDTEPLTK